MAEIIDVTPFLEEQERRRKENARTCENCRFWVPPQYKDGHLIKDSCCGHPGGWTPRWIGPPGPYQKMECNEFKRRDTNAKI